MPTESRFCKQGPIEESREINKATYTFTLETEDGEPLPNNREFFPDLDSLGKHYLVAADSNPHIKRHYTTCTAMNPLIYDALVSSLGTEAISMKASLSSTDIE